MKQVFKFDHKTVIYHGNGQYTVTADHGFILREQGTGNLSLTAYTSDYSRYEVIADEEPIEQEQEPATEEIQEQEPATEEIQEQEPANETRKEAAEEQPKPTKPKKSKKTSVGK